MNLFVLGVSREAAPRAEEARGAVAAVARRSGFFAPEAVSTWRCGRSILAWVTHPPDQVGGIEYAVVEERRAAVFSGRPIRWRDDRGDGRGPLDPRSYLTPAAQWADALDGRFVAARLDAAGAEVVTDALGAYPVFSAEIAGVRWVSNNPTALTELGASAEPRPEILASLLGGGWSLSGDPLASGVERLPRGSLLSLPDGDRRELLPLERVVAMAGAGWDPDVAAPLLVESLRALADWPGRPNVVPVTGGRDSRLVFAAALRAGFPFEATTGGAPEAPDVVVGRKLCELAGVPHVPLAGDPHGDMWTRPRRAAELVEVIGGGTACVADAAGFPLGPREGPLVLWHSGQGGEIARGYYGEAGEGAGADELADRLYRSFTGRRPGRVEPLNEDGERLVRQELRGFVDELLAAGAQPRDVPDLFYLLRRMGTWAGPSHACVEPVKDTTAPLWSRRLLPHLLGPPAADRARELFHLRVLERLAPDLVEVPFEGGRPWPARQSRLRRRAARTRLLARKALAEARRRARASRPLGPEPVSEAASHDPFATVRDAVAEAAAERSGHPAWDVLDRGRVARLLERDPGTLDTMSRYYVWRLGQVLWQRDDA